MRRLLPVLVAAALLVGCNSSMTGPDEADEGSTLRDTPENVIAKLTEAYEAMDRQAYLDCLADDVEYHLSPWLLEFDPTLPGTWIFGQELYEVSPRHDRPEVPDRDARLESTWSGIKSTFWRY